MKLHMLVEIVDLIEAVEVFAEVIKLFFVIFTFVFAFIFFIVLFFISIYDISVISMFIIF